jgi:S1-C subfamily serine protease
MSTLPQPVRLRPSMHAAISRAAVSILLATGIFTGSVSLASDEATPVETATANGQSAQSQQSATELNGQFDWLRMLFAGPSQLSPQELYERVAPSVVTITVSDENDKAIYGGSGFFVDKSLLKGRLENLENDERYARYIRSEGGYRGAYVLTNYHVIRPAFSACIFLSNGDRTVVTHVIAEDEKLDLALLLVSVPESLPAIPSKAKIAWESAGYSV